jgi:GNAT superfamily N-acetyltransferase
VTDFCVRAARFDDLPAIEQLVAGMFRDLGTAPPPATGRIGYVEWLATHPRHRRHGAARLALTELLRWFDEQAIEAVDVHASDSAVPLYTELGFVTPHATPLRRRLYA